MNFHRPAHAEVLYLYAITQENVGVLVDINGFPRRYFGTIASICGDNLGSNALGEVMLWAGLKRVPQQTRVAVTVKLL